MFDRTVHGGETEVFRTVQPNLHRYLVETPVLRIIKPIKKIRKTPEQSARTLAVLHVDGYTKMGEQEMGTSVWDDTRYCCTRYTGITYT